MPTRRRTTTKALPAAVKLGLTGEALADTVHDMAQRLGLAVSRFKKAQYVDRRTGQVRWFTPADWDGKGWPDLFIIDPRGGGFMWREMKGQDEAVKPDQRRWREWLRANGCDFDVWRPADLYSGRIERELKAMVARRPGSPA